MERILCLALFENGFVDRVVYACHDNAHDAYDDADGGHGDGSGSDDVHCKAHTDAQNEGGYHAESVGEGFRGALGFRVQLAQFFIVGFAVLGLGFLDLLYLIDVFHNILLSGTSPCFLHLYYGAGLFRIYCVNIEKE